MNRQIGLALGLALAATAALASPEWPVLKTYAGEHLRRVKLPLGGIGTGTVSLSGRGALVDWEIRNNPAKGFTPSTTGGNLDFTSAFWIRTETADGRRTARLLEGPLDTELYEGEAGSHAYNHGFPRFRDCQFKVAYPLAQVELRDPAVPVRATLEAMNPLVPGDADSSAIPAALLRWRVENVSAGPLKVAVMGLLVNPAGGSPRRELVELSGCHGVSVGSADLEPADDTLGRAALSVPSAIGTVTRATRISDCGWKVRMDRYWKQFVETGAAADMVEAGNPSELPLVAVCVSVDLKPGEVRQLPFCLSWRFPHRMAWTPRYYFVRSGPFDPAREVGNHYAVRFATASAAGAALLARLEELEDQTVNFVRRILAAPAPAVVKEAALFNLSTLRTETCFRTADGHFFGWEGIFDRAGSCFGNCSHVWGYEHALIDLWPDLAKDMTELQFGPAMRESDGAISFRIGLPLTNAFVKSYGMAADGQMQCLVKAYENWKKSGDDAWLRKWYPRFRRGLEYCWVKDGWDGDGDGVMEGCQHNTMDVNYYGPNPQMEFLYLAALKAVAAMAEFVGDPDFAVKCRKLYDRGSEWTEQHLFNGEYYEHQVIGEHDYQLAAGCLVDQLVGDYASRLVGLGPVADPVHAQASLAAVLKYNDSRNVGAVYNCGRDYAFPEEPALKMAWYPPGRMPAKPFPYYGENMTGFEYVVAAALAQRGDFVRAEQVVKHIRDRYDGRKRNPFDEAECGHHYVRALAAWSVLKAYAPELKP